MRECGEFASEGAEVVLSGLVDQAPKMAVPVREIAHLEVSWPPPGLHGYITPYGEVRVN